MEYNADNIFARILRGEIPCNKIYEDDYALAFYDIKPKAKIHALVICKGMFVDYNDFVNHSTDDEIAGYSRAVLKTAEILGVAETGYRIIFNTGKDSGQEVPHLHAHILGGEQLGTDL
jgi:diadenosine tetraphosphate (Ap4A) HIT family hydrolase